eukprot:8479858-Prorocentrum_lima.AAC.1
MDRAVCTGDPPRAPASSLERGAHNVTEMLFHQSRNGVDLRRIREHAGHVGVPLPCSGCNG